MATSAELLAEAIRPAERVLVFTGAGISTASGIPDYRGPQGVWKKREPVYFQEFVASEEARGRFWEHRLESWRAFSDARPNGAHHALVRLEALGKVGAVVTQNIDGLHAAAGTTAEKLLEVHGTNRDVACIACSFREPAGRTMDELARTGLTPRCPDCDGLLKPAVIMFGEALDADVLRRAHGASLEADLVLSLGSSLVVTPAADIPLVGVLRNRAPYVVVNRGETPHDELATLRLDEDLSDLLPAAVSLLEG